MLLGWVTDRLAEYAQAFDFVDRALFTYERAFVGAFNFTSGVNRLDFDYVENRPFYLAVHRQVAYVPPYAKQQESNSAIATCSDEDVFERHSNSPSCYILSIPGATLTVLCFTSTFSQSSPECSNGCSMYTDCWMARLQTAAESTPHFCLVGLTPGHLPSE